MPLRRLLQADLRRVSVSTVVPGGPGIGTFVFAQDLELAYGIPRSTTVAVIGAYGVLGLLSFATIIPITLWIAEST